MATFNGRLYVEEQLTSILPQLGLLDEVIVVDDASLDGTPDIIEALCDPRIRIVRRSHNAGYVAAFEEALTLATGTHIFLSDQDDVWPPGRVALMQQSLQTAQIVAGNVDPLVPGTRVRPRGVIGSWRLRSRQAGRRGLMTVRLALSQAPYYGSALAMRRDLLDLALPFPPSACELHDAWLVLVGLEAGTLAHEESTVVLRRLHGSNASGRLRSPMRVVRGRLRFVTMWWVARRRVRGR